MQQPEAVLDPDRSIRVHRSSVVRVESAPRSEHEVQLKGGARLRVGRSRRALRRHLTSPAPSWRTAPAPEPAPGNPDA